MRQYHFGERVRLAAAYDDDGRPIPSVYRAEVMRPDGSTLERDWDKHDWRLRANQLGVWSWRMYIREDGVTSTREGQFEVMAGSAAAGAATGLRHLLRRALRRA